MKLIVTQPAFCQPVERWRFDRTAKALGGAKSDVINQDNDDIRRACWGLDRKRRGRRGVAGIQRGDWWVIRELR